MANPPPPGSTMRVHTDATGEIITIRKLGGGLIRVGMGLFLLVWLGGWTVGFVSAFDEVLGGEADPFLIFWLAGWSLGGLFAFYFLFRIFRPVVPETFTLLGTSIRYDSGIPAFSPNFSTRSQMNAWKDVFPRRIRHELDQNALRSLALRETDNGNRLTIDIGAKRIDLAKTATEIEREWLYETLSRRYS
jgi:hypothetical protein